MKHVFLKATCVAAASLALSACAVAPGDESDPTEEVGEASDALFVSAQMANSSPWNVTAGWTTDFVATARATGTQNKIVAAAGFAEFPQFEGPLTSARSTNCFNSFMEVYVRKGFGTQLLGPIDTTPDNTAESSTVQVFAIPTIVWDGSQLRITRCRASFVSDWFATGPTDSFVQVDVLAASGNGSAGQSLLAQVIH